MTFKSYPDKYRKCLDALCELPGFVDAHKFRLVRNLIPKGLRVIGSPDTIRHQVNCHGYTFDTNCWYTKKDVLAKIKNGELVGVTRPRKGHVILYFGENNKIELLKHSGIYVGKGKVRSKWSNGPIFKHNIFNVPYSYTSNIHFYSLKKK